MVRHLIILTKARFTPGMHRSLLGLIKDLCIKTRGLPRLSQSAGENSTPRKGDCKSIFRVISIVGEANESLKQSDREEVRIHPRCGDGYVMPREYVVSFGSKRLDIHSTASMKFVGHLGWTSGWYRNLRYPEVRKSGGYGGVVVRRFSTKILKCKRKDSSLKDFKEVMLLGVVELKWLEDYLKDITNKYKMTGELNVLRILKDPMFLLACYGKLKSKEGMMTRGVDITTLDGMNLKWIEETCQTFGNGKFTFSPVRRVEITKPSGGFRYLGIANPRERVVQEAMRFLLELMFEPDFLPNSHGFRNGKSCDTAINYVKTHMMQATWFIEGDISKCFDEIDHQRLMAFVSEKIKDQAFIDLLWKFLRAGYLVKPKGNKDPCLIATNVGVPQGGVLSPILANIYLHNFDRWMIAHKTTFDRGTRRKANPTYTKMVRRGAVRELDVSPTISSPQYRRCSYARYADDFLIGVIGSKQECLDMRHEIEMYLGKELRLRLSLDKTKISHARRTGATFLGYFIHIGERSKDKLKYITREGVKKLVRVIGRPITDAPIRKLVQKLNESGYCSKLGVPNRCGRLIHEDLPAIITRYRAIERGILGYYHKSNNYGRVASRMHYILKMSCALTLVSKLRLRTKHRLFAKFGKDLKIKDAEGKILITYPTVNYKRNKIPLSRNINKDPFQILEETRKYFKRGKMLLQDASCVGCGSLDNIEAHHVRALRKGKSTDWLLNRMIATQRKQLPVCSNCHHKIHKGEYDGIKL
jgi:group II intron reverse transcriptase/maturase